MGRNRRRDSKLSAGEGVKTRPILVVSDKNTLGSRLLWAGQPALLLQGAIEGRWELGSAEQLLAELDGVLRRPKFEARWRRLNTTVDEALDNLRQHLRLVEVVDPPSVHCADADDDVFLACAERLEADFLVTGDVRLLE